VSEIKKAVLVDLTDTSKLHIYNVKWQIDL